jgi:hypothetical protein
MKYFISVSVNLFLLALCVDTASATTLVNGANQTGTIYSNTVDSYTFPANAGDSINVRLGSTGFYGNLQLYGPNGALLETVAREYTDQAIAYTATNSGTFTVLVSSYLSGGTGTYVLNLSQIPEPFVVPAGDGGGTLTNGANATGTITLGRQDLWSFTANKGDSINVRLGSTGFYGNLQLYGPNGALLNTVAREYTDQAIAYTATNSGTFTVLVSSYLSGGTGTYVLNLSQIPEPFVVPAGDGGGTLTNGANATGTITLGRQDLWSFTANKGDSINVRLGSTGFYGNLQLYGPNGALLETVASEYTDQAIAYAATNSGTFTVLVSSYLSGGIGTYALNLAQMPEPFIVPSGDQGGGMTGNASYAGTINLGDQDMWAFTACTGDSINLVLNTTNFDGNLQLYGPDGALLKTAASESTDQPIAYAATNCGTFTVLVSSYLSGGTGTYGLTANGLEDTMRVCSPVISGASLTVNGIGGPTNAGFVLYSTTNIAKSFALWTPLFTNQFNQFGVFSYTNGYNPDLVQEYFRFVLP